MVQTTNVHVWPSFGQGTEHYRPIATTYPNRFVMIGVLLAGLICTILVVARQKPHEIILSSVSPTEFSLSNALAHLKNIAEKPHPLGSAEDAEVRQYLLRTLTDEGLSPEVQELVQVGQASDAQIVISNVIARLKGTNSTKAVLLVAHHDTVDGSPGAGDNGSSVAALLETLRALKAGPPLQNDVILLFTDGEECGLLGAYAFVSQHPWSKDVGLVLNFDARGSRGPVLMFQTGENNGWVVKEFAQAASYPFTSSLFADVYRLLPNNTDFTVFKQKGLQGLNFAFIDGHAAYHNSTDTIENLDPASVAHLGSYALNLTRHFGNLDLTATSAANAIYFDALGAMVVLYPQKWAVPLALFVSALFIGVVGFALKRDHLKLSGILRGAVAFLLTLVAVPLVITLLCMMFLRLYPDFAGPAHSTTTGYLYLAVSGAITIVTGTLIYRAFRNRVSIEEAMVGGLFWWLVGMILTSLFLPSGSYLFTWPLLLMLLALGALVVSPYRKSPAVYVLVLSAGMLLGIILFVPIIFHVTIAVNLMLYGFAMFMLVFVVGLFLPLCNNLIAVQRKWPRLSTTFPS